MRRKIAELNSFVAKVQSKLSLRPIFALRTSRFSQLQFYFKRIWRTDERCFVNHLRACEHPPTQRTVGWGQYAVEGAKTCEQDSMHTHKFRIDLDFEVGFM